MPNFKSIVGQKFGRLRAVQRLVSPLNRRTTYLFYCDCGNFKVMDASNVKNGSSQSCGCLQRELTSSRAKSHGLSRSAPEYSVWSGIRDRCNNSAETNYKNYGGRGISCCKEWDDFAVFLRDMGSRPSSKHSIDRIDVNGNYEPSNCRWVTIEVQANNRRNNHFVEYEGETRTLKQWSDIFGMSYNTLIGRINVYDWSFEKAVTTPLMQQPFEFQGKRLSLADWAKETGIAITTLRSRKRQGWSMEKILTTPAREPIKINFQGVSHTRSEWAKLTGIPLHVISKRLSMGWSVQDTLSQPPMNKRLVNR